MSRVNWGERGRRGRRKAGVKARGPTPGRLWKLRRWSTGGAGGIPGVAVRCVDIRWNTGGEGGLLDRD